MGKTYNRQRDGLLSACVALMEAAETRENAAKAETKNRHEAHFD